MLLCVDHHHFTKLLIELLLREYFQSWHLPDWVECAEVDKLVRLIDGKFSQEFRELIKRTWSCLEKDAIVMSCCLIDIALSEESVENVVA